MMSRWQNKHLSHILGQLVAKVAPDSPEDVLVADEAPVSEIDSPDVQYGSSFL